MLHDKMSAWNKIIVKFRWHYISVCSLVGHGWKQMTMIINGLVTAFSSNNIDIMCASDTGLEPESQNDDDTEQSNKVDNMIDVVYEDETDDEANF